MSEYAEPANLEYWLEEWQDNVLAALIEVKTPEFTITHCPIWTLSIRHDGVIQDPAMRKYLIAGGFKELIKAYGRAEKAELYIEQTVAKLATANFDVPNLHN